MKKTSSGRKAAKRGGEMKAEYGFDYSKAKPNRFAARASAETVAIQLDPDVAAVFRDASAVNSVLRALLETMPQPRR